MAATLKGNGVRVLPTSDTNLTVKSLVMSARCMAMTASVAPATTNSTYHRARRMYELSRRTSPMTMVVTPSSADTRPRVTPARPSSRFMPSPLRYRVALGAGVGLGAVGDGLLHAIGVGLLVLLVVGHDDGRRLEDGAVPPALDDHGDARLEQWRRGAHVVHLDLGPLGGDLEVDAGIDRMGRPLDDRALQAEGAVGEL